MSGARSAPPGQTTVLVSRSTATFEALAGAGLVEHRSAHPVEHVDLADQSVGEREAKDAMANEDTLLA